MKILIVNDDGIDSPLLQLLAELSKALGEVTVVAPAAQCSAMSHRITVMGEMDIIPVQDFPVEGVQAYSVTGTPADCVKVAVYYVCKEKPDAVFSGINKGLNVGFDICYSGTVGAAMEGIMLGIPSYAWSLDWGDDEALEKGKETVKANFLRIAGDLLKKQLPYGYIWNVNFPNCDAALCRGMQWERVPEQAMNYLDAFDKTVEPDGRIHLVSTLAHQDKFTDGSDLRAIRDNYISVGVVGNAVMTAGEHLRY